MDLSDLSKISGGRLLRQIGESLSLAVSPRQFLQMIVHEPPSETWTRLLTLAICYAVFELAVTSLGPYAAQDWSTLRVLGTPALEAPIVLVYVPPIYFVARFLRVASPLRTATAYVLTFRFVFAAIPLILMESFLLTEDYAFAFLKGEAYWLFVAGLVMLFPIAASRSTPQRAFAVVSAVALSVASLSALDGLLSAFHTGTWMSDNSLLADPVGNEIDDLHMRWDYATKGQPLARFYVSVAALWKAHAMNDSTLVGEAGLSASAAEFRAWPQQFGALERTWLRDSTRLQHAESTLVFKTTRRLVALNLEMIAGALSAGRAGAQFVTSRSAAPQTAATLPPTSREAIRLFDAHIEAMDASIAALKEYEAFEHVRSKLRGIGLIPLP